MVSAKRKEHPMVQWLLDSAQVMPVLSAIRIFHVVETESAYGLDATETVFLENALDQMDLNAVYLKTPLSQTNQLEEKEEKK